MNKLHFIASSLIVILFSGCVSMQTDSSKRVFTGPSDKPVELLYKRDELESMWQRRIQIFLDNGMIPLVDLQSSIKRKDAKRYLKKALPVMDELGVALIAFDGYQAPRKSKKQRGYRWGYDVHYIVNAYPDRFILATNGGTNKNWLWEKESFVAETEEHVYSGNYPIMGEFDFRHYMSGRQCKAGKKHRDSYIDLTSDNGHRIFFLSEKSGIPFVIHHEPEDQPLADLERMLQIYPGAKVIVAHFGQIRHPEKQRRFGPALVRHLLSTYPNIYYDISVGGPGRIYRCRNYEVLDTIIWEDSYGSQRDRLKPEYKAILTEFSDRFVVGFDYGGGRKPLSLFLKRKVKVRRLILRDLPEEARHNIAYRNAWKLLTGTAWIR